MIFHIAHKKDWNESEKTGEYKTDSLSNEGFIHCSSLEKIEESANNFFKDQKDLLILCIDEEKVISNVIWEDLYNTNFKFPHIYGKLNVDAVLRTFEFEAQPNRDFKLPEEIKAYELNSH